MGRVNWTRTETRGKSLERLEREFFAEDAEALKRRGRRRDEHTNKFNGYGTADVQPTMKNVCGFVC
jgi:hypothetical protein